MSRRRARSAETVPSEPFFIILAGDIEIGHIISGIEFEWDTLGEEKKPKDRIEALRDFRERTHEYLRQIAAQEAEHA